jgi:hypothetical protein
MGIVPEATVTGPIHLYPVYDAPCLYCRQRINGIVYFQETVRWQVSGTRGVSFFYFHLNCYRELGRTREVKG